jgi:hypothetical protein
MALPPCFGKSWSMTAAECAGGLDPNFRDSTTGTQRRNKCAWFSQCAGRTNATATQTGTRQVIPVQPTAAPRPFIPTSSAHQVAPPSAGWAPPYTAYQGPQFVPVAYQQPGAQMPSYLAVPEPVVDDVPWLVRLLHEIIRSFFKAGGHTLASFFDHTVLTRPRQPPSPPPPTTTA